MRVKCVICDTIENIEKNSLQAKRLRNRRIHMYLCNKCNNRIEKKTKERHATGNFRLYREKKTTDCLL
ncbi:YlaI family protein [Aquibacillus sp. 3ASR75-11]|uniref:YlaI family protein n=1 Tax=Terrihalobacillus insolitus TaxID=2950438 RepID=A0A9X3WR33_9BACI|nr:YlaI family protein [Terrihalobacillus insolitus]MDC3412788.1 YlaI family protein [Terrihalobacillus insolitus]MDC3423735.1 YlaI family protein [Terrihalobacillus insolitus]